jgi:hypothetical protein
MRLDKLKELTDSDRRVIAAALCVIGMLAMYNWLVNPHLASLHAAQRYEQATTVVIDESKSLGLQLQGKRLEFSRLRAQHAALTEDIFQPAEVEPFFGELEHLCTETQCGVQSFGFLEKNAQTRRGATDANIPVLRKTARLVLQADYGNLVRLIEKLQTYRRKVWIDTLKLTLPPAGSGITCDLEISIYIFRSKENGDHE